MKQGKVITTSHGQPSVAWTATVERHRDVLERAAWVRL